MSVLDKLHKTNDVYFCPLIGRSLNFAYDSLTHCCIGVNAKEKPIICHFNGGSFPYRKYKKSFKKYIRNNKMQCGECSGCYALSPGQPERRFEYFTGIYFNHFSKCNLNCIYCQLGHAAWRKKDIVPYNVVETLQDMHILGYINNKTKINWGGGEPTLYNYFKETVEFCIDKGLRQHIDTNAVIYSEEIANLLSRDIVNLRISLDSGTAETYRKIKGVDTFNKVTYNIDKYNNINKVKLKYNVMLENSQNEEIDAFARLCNRIGITEIDISPELHSYFLSEKSNKDKENNEICINAAKKLWHSSIIKRVKKNLMFFNSEDISYIMSPLI